MTGIAVRPLDSLDEFRRAVRLQQEIWGFADAEVVPVRMFVVAAEVGGQVLGAFDGARMIGFGLSFPALKPGHPPFLHSHMVGVLPAYRDRGVGRSIKLFQREDALARGFHLIEWTFDPLEIKNAWFNIERLGAVVRRYVPNQYGIWEDPRYGGLPTDRCVAEWHLTQERPRPPIEARIEVPAAIAEIRRDDPPQAREIQARLRESFLDCFRRGLAVVAFEKTGTYLLGRWTSE